MSALNRLFIWVYVHLLKFYPPEFYANFADEMQETFAEQLESSSRTKLWVGLSEIVSLIVSIARENLRIANRINPVPIWQMAIMLFIPAIAGSSLVFLRSVHIFFLPGKTWWLFLAITMLYIFIGLLTKGRYLLLALPILGIMLNIGETIVWANFYFVLNRLPNYIWYLFPTIALVVVLTIMTWRQADRSWRWLGYVLALPLIGLITGILAIYSEPYFDYQGLRSLIQGYFAGTVFTAGQLSLVFLISLPLAYRFGSKAVTVMIGYICIGMIGLSASLPTDVLQRDAGIVYLVLFLAIVPLLYLPSVTRRFEKVYLLLPVILSYALLFGIQLSIHDAMLTFVVYRTGEMMQTLVILAMTVGFYQALQQKHKNASKRSESSVIKTDDFSMVST